MTSNLPKPKNFAEVLAKLTHGKQRGDEYTGDCPCPGHKTPDGHLSLKDGGDKALANCFPEGGHTYDQICEAWGFSSLNYAQEESEKDKGEWITTASFPYEIEPGKVYYTIDRQERGKKKKFTIWHKARSRIIRELGELKPILYNLPAVKEAIKAGKPVLNPEGEGKASALNKLGYTATTNPFGAGKWEESYTATLIGADVVIFKDYDKPGLAFAQLKAKCLYGKARRVRVAELTDIDNLRKFKGKDGVDIIDWLAAGHTTVELQAIIDASTDWQPLLSEDIDDSPIPNKYIIRNGCLVRLKPIYYKGEIVDEEEEVLCNFNARIIENVIEDNGLEITRFYRIIGERYDHKPLDPVYIKTSDFNSLSWTTEWCTDVEIVAGQAVKDHLQAAIRSHSRKAEKKTIYKHTGWRVFNNNPVFLTGAGPIGDENVTVELEHRLGGIDINGYPRGYYLPKPVGDATDPVKCFKSSRGFLEVGPHNVTLPLWAILYLSPLCQLFEPDFTLWYLGESGTLKSGLTGLGLCHFGFFDYLHLPTNWLSTANRIEEIMFYAKDVPCVVDDWFPGMDPAEKRELEVKAGRILRSQGNLQGRGRMTRADNNQKQYDSRCILISSGERLPSGVSRNARVFTVELKKGQIDLKKIVAAHGDPYQDPPTGVTHLYRGAMYHYINWLRANMPKLRPILKAKFSIWHTEAVSYNTHLRLPSTVCKIYAGLYTAMLYGVDIGAIDSKEAQLIEDEAWNILLKLQADQSERIQEETPLRRFIAGLKVVLDANKAVLGDIDETIRKETRPGQIFIGWRDYSNGHVMLLGGPAIEAVARYYDSIKDLPFMVNKNTLWREMAEMSYIEPKDKSLKRLSDIVYIKSDQKTVNVFNLKLSVIEEPLQGALNFPADGEPVEEVQHESSSSDLEQENG